MAICRGGIDGARYDHDGVATQIWKHTDSTRFQRREGPGKGRSISASVQLGAIDHHELKSAVEGIAGEWWCLPTKGHVGHFGQQVEKKIFEAVIIYPQINCLTERQIAALELERDKGTVEFRKWFLQLTPHEGDFALRIKREQEKLKNSGLGAFFADLCILYGLRNPDMELRN